MSSKILILFLFFLFIYSKDLYFSGKNPRPDNFCLDHELIDIPLTSDSVAIDSQKVKYTPENKLDTVTLTESGVQYRSSYMYLSQPRELQNGFVLSFNMDIDRPTCYVFDDTQCSQAINQCWWRANKEIKSRCGADGFAVILRFSPYNTGICGGGMGYAGIMNALAIEFDTFTSTDRNDPKIEEERHISVIVKPGENLADEDNSIAWNYQPLNFKSDLFEGFLKNPSYRIEYLNRYLRVFINDKLQLEFYDDLDLRTRIKNPNHLLYLGIVAATGESTNDHILSNVKVAIVKPTVPKFKIEFEEQTTTFKSYESFHIKVYMYDNCGNFYTPNFEGEVDSYKYLSIMNDGCDVINLQNGEQFDYKSGGPAFIISMKCTKVGNKEFKVLYKEETIFQTLKATIIAGDLYKAEVLFYGGSGSTDATEGRADKPFVFDVKTYDFAGNRVDTNEDELRNRISILWPKASDSRTDYLINKKQDGIWTFTLICNFIGHYKIKSSLFFVYTSDSEYVFKIIAGSPDLMKSQGKIYSSTGTQMKENEIFAGTQGLLKVTFVDKLGNFVTKVDVEKYAVELKTMLGSDLLESNYLQPIMSSRIVFTKKGGNKVIPTYENGQINCPYCQFNVKPGAPVFQNSGLLIFDDEKTQYVINSGPEFVIVKPKQMNFLFVLKDEYFNVLDVFDQKGFSATLSGNNMTQPLELNMESFANGAKITTKAENQETFDVLVGLKGYVITVKNDKGETLQFPLTIKSDGSDSDADNNALFPQWTVFSWITPIKNNLWATAGNTYKLSIRLVTITGKRYPRWIPNDQISLTIISFREDEKVFQIQRDQKPGTYTVEFIVKKAGTETRSGLIRVNGANAIKGPKFKVSPGNPSIATIDELNMKDGNNNLKDATVFTEYVFQVHLRDDYKNAVSDPSKLNLLVQNIDKKEISFVPECVETSIGEYNCKFTPNSAGNFKVQSGYINTNYNLVILNGEPSALTTKASIINDLSVELKAGEIIKFKITPKDSTGALLRKQESSSSINNYTLTLRKPDGSLLGITISSNNIQENGEILTETEVTLAGMYSYSPLLFGKNIMCEICAFELVANVLDHTKIKVFTLNKDTREEIKVDQTIMIDNKKILPIYYIQFYDKYYNRRSVNADYTEWTGVLTVPNSKEKSYNLISKNVNGDIQYNINSDKYEMFETELFQENCSLFFKGKNSVDGLKDISVLFPKVILNGNGENDKIYSDDSIDPKNCRVSPSKISILAGEFVTISIELRAPNGKLYYDRPLGWFNQTNMSKAFKLILFDDQINEFNVTTGKLYGTYSVSFILTVANYREEDLIVSYLDSSSNKYVEINQRASITVQPNSFNFLLLQNPKAVEQDCIATEVRSLSFIAYDRYNNKINYTAQASLVGLQVKTSNYSINPSFDSDSNTNLIKISFECKIVGLISVLSTKFLEKYNGEIVKSYQINVVAGPISPKNSLAKLNKDSITAGESVIWTVYPKDIYDNVITIDKNNVNHLPALFISSETIENVEKSIGNANIVDNTYQWEITLTKAGVHSFKTFYQSAQKDLISSSFNKVTVAPLNMIFENVNLAKYEKSSANFLEYDSVDGFSQDVKEVPEFRLNFYDKYANRIETTNILFDSRLFLDDPSLETFSYQQRIEFCSSDNIRYSICENNGENQTKLEQNPRTRWSVLVPNLQYRLNLINKKDLSTKFFILNVTGLSNNDTSNLPLDVDNTIIQPNTLFTTIAGQSTQFSIELRTTKKKFLV